MTKRKPTNFDTAMIRAGKLLNVLLNSGVLFLCWHLCYEQGVNGHIEHWEQAAIWLLFVLLYASLSHTYDGFSVSTSGSAELMLGQTLAVILTDVIAYLVFVLLSRQLLSVFPLLLCLAMQLLISYLWAQLSRRSYFSRYKPKDTVVIHGTRGGLVDLIKKYELDREFRVIANISISDWESAPDQIDSADVIFLNDVEGREKDAVIKYCICRNIDIYLIPSVADSVMSGAERLHLLHLPVLRVRRYDPNIEYVVLKRAFDILLSLVGILVLSPVMLVTAAAIKLDSPGPVFYRQDRLTKNGKIFRIIKFRSMFADAEADGRARLSTGESDERVTRVGRILRTVRIDEIPQLFNVLEGSMSLVGPRPERPEIAEEYYKLLPDFVLRLQAKAGLTGYAQVYGKYNTTPYDKLQMDLLYIANPGLLEDLRILLATAKVLFEKESTEGVGSDE